MVREVLCCCTHVADLSVFWAGERAIVASASLNMDLRQFHRAAHAMGIFASDQVPYAISRSINDTLFQDTRPQIIGPTWAAAFTQRNRGLPRASIRVEKSTKGSLVGAVYDALGKANLAVHATGGARPKPRAQLAIPNQQRVRLHARGRTPWARNVPKMIPARALRVIPGKGIFEGREGRLHAIYWFRPSAKLDKRFRFHEDFASRTRAGIMSRFPAHLQTAFNSMR
jgi:hypothetical protein